MEIALVAYGEVRSVNVANPFLHPLSMTLQAFLLIGPTYLVAKMFKKELLAQVLLLTLCLHVLVVFTQGKGFFNHFLAAKGATFVLWAFAVGYASTHKEKYLIPPSVMLGILSLVWIAWPVSIGQGWLFRSSGTITAPANAADIIVKSISNEPKSSRIFVASTNAGFAFFVQWSQARPHYSRYFAMWMLPGLLTSQLVPQQRETASAQLNLALKNTVVDIYCTAPTLIIGDTTTHGKSDATGFHSYDIKPMTFLTRDPAFKAWLTDNYTQSVEEFGVTTWRSKLPNGPMPSNCQPNPR